MLKLRLEEFSYEDLYDPSRLAALDGLFCSELEDRQADLGARFRAYREGAEIPVVEESELLIEVAGCLSNFVARMFGIEAEVERYASRLTSIDPVWEFKRQFLGKTVKRVKEADLEGFDASRLDRVVETIARARAESEGGGYDLEAAFAASVLGMVAAVGDSGKVVAELREALDGFWSTETPADDGAYLEALLTDIARWCRVRSGETEAPGFAKDWVCFKVPEKVDFDNLVELESPDRERPWVFEGPVATRRRRDGFKLTDRRYSEKQVMSEVDYCILCHGRDKDSCNKGVKDKSGGTARNPLGIALEGCPLDEKISEMQSCLAQGDSIAALAIIMIDNPMVPGTGHRICNDCMKGCIYQKFEPVNIPQIETRVLVDVLDLPWGFELYCLLARWNPLNRVRPYARPYVGKNVLVVGMGPSGYTLAHYLLNEGYGVVGIDGLKMEPLAEGMACGPDAVPTPVRDFADLYEELDERPLMGFGGVAEYGITVRWDKNFLKVIRICLERQRRFLAYGGVRFGGTITIDDAWEMGFDHIAIATGAGKPTILAMKNNLIRGVRKASDFLMALQLTGAQKRNSMTNPQVRLPAIVIGGGLTGIDTSTEVMAYYTVQVEKTLLRYQTLCESKGEEFVRGMYGADELAILDEFVAHGRAVRAERERAEAAGENPDFVPLLRSWGGVTLAYRKGLRDSPAYRLNHEEIAKALEEGIYYAERLAPVEALGDEYGALESVIMEKQRLEDGRWRGSGENITMPARSMFVAAGTSPNVIYEREYPGTFEMDERDRFFKRYRIERGEGGPDLVVDEEPGDKPGVFTSYRSQGRFISFLGDNHPSYAGNVVKAMASARDGYRQISDLLGDGADEGGEDLQERRRSKWERMERQLEKDLRPTIREVIRLTPNIVEVVVDAPGACRRFEPGQFFRLQNFETLAPSLDGTRLAAEGMALTGAWVDKDRGLLSTIVLEMGGSSRLCATWSEGTPVVLMGPTGAPTEIPEGETAILFGGGLGNAVQFSIGKAMRDRGNRVVYFAAYKKPEDVYHVDDIEAASDVIVWSVDAGEAIRPRRPQDKSFVGNILEAMQAYATGELGQRPIELSEADRLIAIGSDRMMAAVAQACRGSHSRFLKEGILCIGSINSTMQCMMKAICAQCLQKHLDPETGEETQPVFSCFNQDQRLDEVDFANLNNRLRMNSVLEKLTNLWLSHLFERHDLPRI